MRTTLDIDPAVLSAARAKARADRVSLGTAISELARAGMRVPRNGDTEPTGFPVMSGVAGHMVTDELVATYADDDPRDIDAA